MVFKAHGPRPVQFWCIIATLLVGLAWAVCFAAALWSSSQPMRLPSASHRVSGKPILIAAVPVILSQPGHYQLAANLHYRRNDGSCIQIGADNVMLDLNGFALRCASRDPQRSCIGVLARHRNDLTIRNGTIQGFETGILIEDAWRFGANDPVCGGHTVRSVLIKDSLHRGIAVQGECCTVEDNRVWDTGPFGVGNFVYGIECIGPYARVLRNRVVETTAGKEAEAVGISFNDSSFGSIAEANQIANRHPAQFRSIAIWVGHRSVVSCIGNHVTNFTWGLTYSSPTQGQFRNNIIAACEIPICLCGVSHELALSDRWHDGGGNVIHPAECESPDTAQRSQLPASR